MNLGYKILGTKYLTCWLCVGDEQNRVSFFLQNYYHILPPLPDSNMYLKKTKSNQTSI